MLKSPSFIKILIIAVIIISNLSAVVLAQAQGFDGLIKAAWLPYWSKTAGLQEITANLNKFQEISPFAYGVSSSGGLIDQLKINQDPWQSWLKNAQNLDLKIIPTVAWFKPAQIYKVLANKTKRQKHLANIMSIVNNNNFAGIDIDYENKTAASRNYFSAFIKELSAQLHQANKLLTCTIEPRDTGGVVTDDSKRANDYSVLNDYCDEVRLMAYDQGRNSTALNRSKGSKELYAPVADPDWVESVIKSTILSINPNKLMLGVPTYGYVYQVSQTPAKTTYKRLKSLTYKQTLDLMALLDVAPSLNLARELSFTYYQFKTQPTTQGTPNRLVCFNSGPTILDKISLAEKYNLRGVILFKVDGQNDPDLWEGL